MGAIAISRMRAMLVGAGQLDVGIATLFCRLFSRIAQTGGFDQVRRCNRYDVKKIPSFLVDEIVKSGKTVA